MKLFLMLPVKVILILGLGLLSIFSPLTNDKNENQLGIQKNTNISKDFSKVFQKNPGFQLENKDKKPSILSCTNDGVLKILAIGNSFSEDAIENYLFDLGAAEEVDMVIGNLYIGGSSLEQHLQNANENAPVYQYRKISQNGVKTNTPNSTIAFGILNENWDYISFQQVSGKSGEYETFIAPLTDLLKYVKKTATCKKTKFILHQTWAYEKNSTHVDFSNYNNDQEQMYNSIVETYRKVGKQFNVEHIIPAGTAIQNGRNTFIGDNFTRDGYHLNLNIGRFTAACTWFESLTGIPVVGNRFAPANLTNIEIEIAQHIAHAAVKNPDKITILPCYESSIKTH